MADQLWTYSAFSIYKSQEKQQKKFVFPFL